MTTIDFPILQVKRNRISRTRVLAVSFVALGLAGCVTDSGGPVSTSVSTDSRADQAAPVKINYLTPAAAFELQKSGNAIIVDIGSREDYDNWHVRGAAYTAPGDLAKLAANQPQVFVLYDSGMSGLYREDVMTFLRAHPETTRVIKGGLSAWQSAGLPINGKSPANHRCESITPEVLQQATRDGYEINLIDVRAKQDFDESHIPSSQHSMPDKLGNALKLLKKNNWVVVYDRNGQLGQFLAEELSRQKFSFCGYLAGGYQAWSSPAPTSSRK